MEKYCSYTAISIPYMAKSLTQGIQNNDFFIFRRRSTLLKHVIKFSMTPNPI